MCPEGRPHTSDSGRQPDFSVGSKSHKVVVSKTKNRRRRRRRRTTSASRRVLAAARTEEAFGSIPNQLSVQSSSDRMCVYARTTRASARAENHYVIIIITAY